MYAGLSILKFDSLFEIAITVAPEVTVSS